MIPLLVALALSASSQSPPNLEIHFFDVGHGDAILIREGPRAMLIDAGLADDSIVPRLRQLGVDSLQLFVASHNHGDHIGSGAAVLRAFPVRLFIGNDASLDTPNQHRLDSALVDRGTAQLHGARKSTTLGDIQIEVIPPPQGVDTFQNNHSMVVRITRGKFRALFTGDSERSEVEALLAHEHLTHVDLLKAPHHGDPESITPEWLRRLSPGVVVVSTASGELTAESVTKYSGPGRRLFRTDTDGDVTVLVDAAGGYTVTTGPRWVKP